MGKRRLGKGLDALIFSGAEAPAVRQVELSRIELNPRQPRERMDPEALEGLAESVRSAGILQPVVVRRRGEGFELVIGERRLRAAQMAGLQSIPALVRDVSEEQMLEFALVENVQREDLAPIEKARAVRLLIEDLALTQEEAAERLGLKRPTVANLLRLLELPPEVQEMVSRGTLSAGHARAVLSVEGDELRCEFARRIAEGGLSVREAERLAAGGLRKAPRSAAAEPSPHLMRLEAVLREAVGTRVEIHTRGKGGRIVVHFADQEEFERIFGLISGSAEEPGGW